MFAVIKDGKFNNLQMRLGLSQTKPEKTAVEKIAERIESVVSALEVAHDYLKEMRDKVKAPGEAVSSLAGRVRGAAEEAIDGWRPSWM